MTVTEPTTPEPTTTESTLTTLGSSTLFGYALAVPGIETSVAVDETFLRGDLTPFESAEGNGTLRLVAQPLEWQVIDKEYVVLVLERAQIARAPALYLVLLERQNSSFVPRGVERLGENLVLVGLESEAVTLKIRALGARLGRLPAPRGLDSHFYLFGLINGSLHRLE